MIEKMLGRIFHIWDRHSLLLFQWSQEFPRHKVSIIQTNICINEGEERMQGFQNSWEKFFSAQIILTSFLVCVFFFFNWRIETILCLKQGNRVAAKSLQSCPTRCDPIDGSPSGSADPGILPARVLEWVAISFSKGWKWKVKVKSLQSCPTLSDPMDRSPPVSSAHGIFQARVLEWAAIAFSGDNRVSGCHYLLPMTFVQRR